MELVGAVPPAVEHPVPAPSVGSCGGLFAAEAEAEVLGAVMLAALLARETGWQVLDRAVALGLCAEHFHSEAMAFLFRVVIDLREAGQPVDPLAVATECERRCLANIALGIVDVDWRTLHGRIVGIARMAVATNVVDHRAGLVITASANRSTTGEY